MSYTINIDKYSFAEKPNPQKVSRDYAAQYAKVLTENLDGKKADKATSLIGYGITDAYTKTETDNKISELIDAAPETLNTLNELASALGKDANFSTTVLNKISDKTDKSEFERLNYYGNADIFPSNENLFNFIKISDTEAEVSLKPIDENISVGSTIIVPYKWNNCLVTKISSLAFFNKNCNTVLKKIVLPESIKEIGSFAFRWCQALVDINIPHSVTKIGTGAFWDCDSLINIPDIHSVTEIGQELFTSCDNLVNIEIPKNIVSIGEKAFSDCKNLKYITFLNDSITIADDAFNECTDITFICNRDSNAESYAYNKEYKVNFYKNIHEKVDKVDNFYLARPSRMYNMNSNKDNPCIFFADDETIEQLVIPAYMSDLINDLDAEGNPPAPGGYYSKLETDDLLTGKVDKLSGFGLTQVQSVSNYVSISNNVDGSYTSVLVPSDSYFSTEMANKANISDLDTKADKTTVMMSPDMATNAYFKFISCNNLALRCLAPAMEFIEFTFDNAVYEDDHTCELSFNSGETPPMISYADSGILNWLGTDCSIIDGYSVFAPTANKHYDIVFYFNGTCFVGLVNGFEMATVNNNGV